MTVNGIGTSGVKSNKRVNITIKSTASGFNADLEAFVLKQVTTCQPSKEVDISEWKIPTNLKLADPSFNLPSTVDIIIGGEILYKVLSVGMQSLGENLPDIQNTVFGWVVIGRVLGLKQNEAFIGVLTEDPIEKQVQDFWKVEEKGEAKRPFSSWNNDHQ